MESVDDVTRRRRRQDELCGAEVLPGGMTKQNKTKKNNFERTDGGGGEIVINEIINKTYSTKSFLT